VETSQFNSNPNTSPNSGQQGKTTRLRQLAIDKYIKSNGYKIATLVAFSGEVNDSESGPDGFMETSRTLNPNLTVDVKTFHVKTGELTLENELFWQVRSRTRDC
jgi:hypothetical protein